MKFSKKFQYLLIIAIIVIVFIFYKIFYHQPATEQKPVISVLDSSKEKIWIAPDTNSIPMTPEGDLIRYGRSLIVNTSYYLGPKGKVAHLSNGMNCENCHLDAGARPFSNCLAAVASRYPMFRARSGRIESIEYRVNDCMQRSLNGKPLDSLSKEMSAMVAYLKWLGKDVPKGTKPLGAGAEELAFMNRPADTVRGRLIYIGKCQTCHQPDGQGIMKPDSSGYIYPPLWGPHSYNDGAGLYRLSKFAAFVEPSMPFGAATHSSPQLADLEAWDVAAYINSRPRPVKKFSGDWPDISKKSLDEPFGPYADSFSEIQHKYGPYGPIKAADDELKKKK